MLIVLALFNYIRMKPLLFVSLLLLLRLTLESHASYPADNQYPANIKQEVSIMTYVSNHEQERAVRAMLKSIRELSVEYHDCKLYVVIADTLAFPCHSLQQPGVELVPLNMNWQYLAYPLAIKAFAAAQVERLVSKKCHTLIWLDPGVMVLNSLENLDLKGRLDVAVRAVSLSNTISILPGTEPNDYWRPIYKANKLDFKKLPQLQTIVDEVDIQPYYNCEVYAINPAKGIGKEWARQLEILLQDEKYQKEICNSSLRRLFLHQAVLSGIISAKVAPQKMKTLPISSGYPLTQNQQLAASKKVDKLNQLSVVIFDYAWAQVPQWLDIIPADEPLKSWLIQAYTEYLSISPNLYRIEGSCNSYLVTTPEGSVLIDPAGASVAPQYFRELLKKHPLKAILLTHAHQDHSDDIATWRSGKDIPVIAQREFSHYFEYQSEFAGFFAERNAIWARKPLPAEVLVKPDSRKEPNILFADDYHYELGGIHFNLIHTPGETPDHTTIWIPELSSVLVGDNYYEYFINNSTFRGTMIRPVKGYIHALDTALSFNPEFVLPGHGVPIVGQKDVASTVGNFKNALTWLNNETVKGINEGKDVYTLMRTIKIPAEYRIGEYYGKAEWTIRGIYQEYVGWFDKNPASMYDQHISSIFGDLAEMAGKDALIGRAEALLAEKAYVKVLHLTDVILYAYPGELKAKEIRIQALKSLKAGTNNFIEKIWLDYGIRNARED